MTTKLKIPPLRPYMVFTDKDGNLTPDAYNFLFGMFQRVGGSLSSLNAAQLQNGVWEIPGKIGYNVPNVGRFTAFGCNNKPAQVSYTLGPAATDLASVITLVNNIRTALINNGIGV